jgi:hypothetical protein
MNANNDIELAVKPEMVSGGKNEPESAAKGPASQEGLRGREHHSSENFSSKHHCGKLDANDVRATMFAEHGTPAESRLRNGVKAAEHQRSRTLSSATDSVNRATLKGMPVETNLRPSMTWRSQPGAFRLFPGLPPIPAEEGHIYDDTETSHDDASTVSPHRKQLVLDGTLVEDDNQPAAGSMSEIQHAMQVDPAQLSIGVFRRRALILLTLTVLFFVVSTTAGIVIATGNNTTTLTFRNISFEEFTDALLPEESRKQAMSDSLSPQGQALEWLKRDMDGSALVGWRIQQRFSLSTLFFSLNGDSWYNKSGWLSASDECSWNVKAASCDMHGHISVLSLSDNNLAGSIPDELSLLADLENIFMNDNNITGTLPKSMFTLNKLARLELEENALEGTLPTEVGSATGLISVMLSKNRLEGTVPTEFGMLTLLKVLTIDSNRLGGSLPTAIGLMRDLETLFADCNSLTGSIPTEIGMMANLTGLAFERNQLSGSIPTEFGRLQKLAAMSMDRNGNVRGTIPSQFGLLVSLQQLYLDQTSLSGTIPSEM